MSGSFSHIPKKRKIQPSAYSAADDDDTDDAGGGAAIVNGFTETGVGQPGPAVEPPAGRYTVLKFGGSSVGTAASLAQVLGIVRDIVSGGGHSDGPSAASTAPTASTAQQQGEPVLAARAAQVAVVVSAQGNTTDWLLDAADFASTGKLEQALHMVDRVAEQAITNAFAAVSIPAGRSPGSSRESSPGNIPVGFIQEVRKLLKPLRKLMEGMSLLREKTPQGLDYALSFGERLSAYVLARLLNARGIGALAVDARSWVQTDAHFGDARVDWEKTRSNVQGLWVSWGDRVTVHTGFIGQTADGRTTTLGRNGSDYTATLLAGSLRAAKVVINTDVPGVMTADPRIVADAVPVSNLTFSEALELAVYGSRLFHPRTFFPLIQTDVPMLIRNTMDTGSPGTLISKVNKNVSVASPTCVTSLENLAMLQIKSLVQQAAANPKLGIMIATCLAESRSTVYMEAKAAHGQSMTIVIPQAQLEPLKEALDKTLAPLIQQEEVAPITVVQPVAMLSVVLEQMQTTPNVFARVTTTLGGLGINVLRVTSGPRSFTCLIDGQSTPRAVRGVHNAFNMSRMRCSLVVLGAPNGMHGSSTTAVALPRIIHEQRAHLERDQSLNLRIVGTITQSGQCLFNPEGISIDDAVRALDVKDGSQAPGWKGCGDRLGIVPVEVIEALKALPNPILVDCSGSDCHEALYQACLADGINVIVSNARSVHKADKHVLRMLRSTRCIQAAPPHCASVCCDSTVGGSLPVLSTIRSLQDTGDRVVKIECALSSSINAVTEHIQNGSSLSEAVAAAIESRYMEYDPRIDLSGADFAWKLSVTAWFLGIELSEQDIQIEPLVGADMLGSPVLSPTDMTPDAEAAILANLRGHDAAMAAKYAAETREGKRLRLVGTIDLVYEDGSAVPVQASASIGPKMIAGDHPLFGVNSKEVYVGLTTERHHQLMPLTIRGAGQGGIEGASGLLGDIIRTSRRLRGWGSGQ